MQDYVKVDIVMKTWVQQSVPAGDAWKYVVEGYELVGQPFDDNGSQGLTLRQLVRKRIK